MEFINTICLSYSSLQYAVNICQEKEKYMVGIAIEDEVSNQEAKDFLLTLIKDYDNIEYVIKSNLQFRMVFKNGSMINFMDTSGHSRGQRYNLLIADENVPECIMRSVVLRCWTPYSWSQREKYEFVRNGENELL